MTSKFNDMTGHALEAAVEGALSEGGNFAGHALQEQAADLLSSAKSGFKLGVAGEASNPSNERDEKAGPEYLVIPQMKPTTIMDSFDLMAMRHRAMEASMARGPGFHDIGNDTTLARLDGVQILTKGKEQIVLTADGKVNASEGAEIKEVKLMNRYLQAPVRGTQVSFPDGLSAIVSGSEFVQFGDSHRSLPSGYRVVDSNKH